MDAAMEATQIPEVEESQGATIVLPGQTPKGEYILSVLLKRTYDMIPDRPCVRAENDRPLVPGDVPWGNPMNSSVRYESDFVPYKLGTDIVLNGKAHAPGGTPTSAFTVAMKVEKHRKDIRVTGDRKIHSVKSGIPIFSDPKPFTTMDLRYERSYGGIDVYSDKQTAYPYPRNPLGKGFIVENTKEGIENLELPNLEDPKNQLTPDRLIIKQYARWKEQPMPVSFGWLPKHWHPRSELAGVMPADRPTEQELRKAYAEFLPADQKAVYLKHGLPDMDFHFFNGASKGLAMPFIKGNEQIATANLCPQGVVYFYLSGDRPQIGLDIGEGIKKPKTVIQTVMIHTEENQLDVVWRAAVPYPGPDWLVEMSKMEVVIT
jgi:hypothetical protein